MDSTYIEKKGSIQNQAELYYKKSVDLQTRDGICLINKTSLVEGSTVLDLGCGTGNLTAVLAEKVGPTGRVLGIDPDRERINFATKNDTSANASFIQADGETFPEDKYDLVFSNYVLHWIEDKEAVFKRVHANLRPGGQFTYTLCQALPPLCAELLKTMKSNIERAIVQMHYFTTVSELQELATTTGYTVAYQEMGVSRLPFLDYDSALDFLYASTNGQINPATADKTGLEQLKQKYTNKSVEFAEEYATFILVKD